nr:putative SCO family protein [uncultured bacterium]
MKKTYRKAFGTTHTLLLVFMAILFLGLGLFAGHHLQQRSATEEIGNNSLQTYPEPRIIADFALIDQHGEEFSLAALKGRWHLVFLGFTHCPDICPTTLGMLATLAEQLRGELTEAMQPGVVFISVDPERDQPQQLRQYVTFFDPGFTAVTGAAAQLKALSYQLGAVYMIEEHEAGVVDYNVDHSSGIFLLDPQARLKGVFPAPHRSQIITAELKQLILAGGDD